MYSVTVETSLAPAAPPAGREVICIYIRSVARKETLGVHQKNWVCHIYCQINAQKKTKNQACLLGINMLV